MTAQGTAVMRMIKVTCIALFLTTAARAAATASTIAKQRLGKTAAYRYPGQEALDNGRHVEPTMEWDPTSASATKRWSNNPRDRILAVHRTCSSSFVPPSSPCIARRHEKRGAGTQCDKTPITRTGSRTLQARFVTELYLKRFGTTSTDGTRSVVHMTLLSWPQRFELI